MAASLNIVVCSMSTLPNLKFFVTCWEGWEAHIKEVDTIMERYGKGKIPIEKFELSVFCSGSPELFPLVDKWLLIALQNGVKELVLRFSSYPAPILIILATKSLRELVLHDCTLMPISLSSGVVNCNSLRKISLSDICDIDAPNLVSLDYTGSEIPELNIARESSQLKNSKIILHCIYSINTAWFCELRKFLSNLSSWSEVNLCLLKCDEINMTDMQMDHRGSTGWVDVLNLNMLMMNQIIESPTFVDALLWSCHPGRLNLISIDIETVTRLIDHLMCMKNSSHSTSHGSTPWNNQLKEIKVFDVKNQSLQLESEELAKKITEREQPYFILD
ncbi:hypothetical protein H5410_047461, partial [Solanum commersonii]